MRMIDDIILPRIIFAGFRDAHEADDARDERKTCQESTGVYFAVSGVFSMPALPPRHFQQATAGLSRTRLLFRDYRMACALPHYARSKKSQLYQSLPCYSAFALMTMRACWRAFGHMRRAWPRNAGRLYQRNCSDDRRCLIYASIIF